MNRIAFACLWFFVFTIPWEMSLQLGTGIGSIGRVAGFVALVAGVWAVGVCGRVRRIGWFQVLALAFLLLVTASIFWTADPVESPHIIRVYYQSMWVLWLVWEFGQSARRISQLRTAFVLGECVAVALTVQTFLNERIVEHAKEARFAAQGWDWNDLAIMLVLGVPLACSMAVKSERLWERWLGRSALLLSIIGILLTSSRTGLVGLAVALLTIPLLRPRFSGSAKLLGLPVAAAALYAIAVWLPAQTFQRLGTTLDEATSGTMDYRLSIWKVGLLAFPEHWFVGLGAGAWIAGTGNFYSPHNTYLQILVEEGIVGFTLYLLLLLFAGRAIYLGKGGMRVASAMLLSSFMVCTFAIHWAQLPATWFVLAWIVAQGHVEGAAEPTSLSREVGRHLPVNDGAAVASGWN